MTTKSETKDDKAKAKHDAKAAGHSRSAKFVAPGSGEPYTEEAPTGVKRPARIHPLPHVTGVPHEPGVDPDEAMEEAKEAVKEAKGDDEDKDAAPAPDPATPFPDYQSQMLYGLRKEGRLYRCRLQGYETVLVEADTPEEAKEAALCEFRRLAGEEQESKEGGKKGSKKDAKEAGGGLPAMPAGFVAMPVGAIDPSLAKAPVAAEAIRVVKLAP